MADQQDEKSKLPLTGLLALVLAAVSSLIIYQVPLKTSRPIEKEAERTASIAVHRVQSRLWQDPFEAVTTHRSKETASQQHPDKTTHTLHGFHDLIMAIKAMGGQSDFVVLPVFVDGNPYASGVEARLRDRYAVISALGTAGYLPESGEYIRFFEWQRTAPVTIVIPVEWFVLKSSGERAASTKQVLVLWLKDQDFGPTPLAALGHLVAHMNHAFGKGLPAYRILGPRSSGSLASMVSELKEYSREPPSTKQPHAAASLPDSDVMTLKGSVFYSSWATAANPFLLGTPPEQGPERTVEEWFTLGGLSLVRTIGTDALLAEQLVEDLQRRGIELFTPPVTSTGCDAPHVALISEWDTLYGRALPRTFVAAAEHRAEKNSAKEHNLEDHIDTSAATQWPCWVRRYSYLAGLDGELPPKTNEKEAGGAQSKDQSPEKILRAPQSMEEAPTGRSQLDYLRRLAATLKQEESTIAEGFTAIGVLGSDVYDKLMILQALRKDFPHAVFFTTDLDARLTHSGQGQWTRNLVVASHFGLELHPELQTPIPPFRDSYQTALFYSTLQAVNHIVRIPQTDDVRNAVTELHYSTAGVPRLYELGRHGAVDLSVIQPGGGRSIHPPRQDLDPASGTLSLPTARTIGVTGLALGAVVLCALLINSEFLDLFRVRRHRIMLFSLLVFAGVTIGLLMWAMRDGAAGEPFSFTQGVSVWPTTFLRLLACVLCGIFFYYSSIRLRENDRALALKFGLFPSKARAGIPCSPLGIHLWRPHAGGSASATDFWLEYQTLGRWTHRLIRIVPQTLCYGALGWLLMNLFGAPTMPCRGSACFEINGLILLLSVLGMILLMFYVVDATRLCRRLIKIMIATKIHWPSEILAQEAVRHHVDTSLLNEWLGIELIAQRTAVISFMLYYPFIILFLMGVARHTYFDRWDFPVSLMVIFGLNAAYALGNAMYLRRSAEEAKHTALTQLRNTLAALPEESVTRKQGERMADLIDHNRQGAFLPFTQQPLFGAIALPTGGTGLVLLIEYVATML